MANATVDEEELLSCIRNLVLESTQSEDDFGKDTSITRSESDENLESNEEYQALVKEVEEKLIQFLDDQVRTGMVDQSEGNAFSANVEPAINIVLPIHTAHAYPCSDTHKTLPSPPKDWPQRPVMMRPSPGSSTKIRGIRYASDRDYKHFSGFCAGCILPVNTGKEKEGESLVIDFESSHFVGTLLMRIKDIPAAEKDNPGATGSASYFDNRKRRFQGIVKGKFKTALPMSECVTGQTFDRRAGKLPAKWVVSAFVKFVSSLAPQLETTIDGDNPRFLVPLSATAHTVIAKQHTAITNDLKNKVNDSLFNYSVYLGSTDIEGEVQEPPGADETSIIQDLPSDQQGSTTSKKPTISSRMKARKKAYNAVSANRSDKPCFSLDKEYTFEFYQHLLIFHEPEFVLDMGRPIGKIPLSPITDGQPIKFMSAHKHPTTGVLDSLWSFDIWHESMYPLAQTAQKRRG